jgi:hypothetical protein
MKRKPTILEQLRRACIRYGLVPEDIGPASTFADDQYMADYLRFMSGWEPPSAYGCTQRHRDRARKAWAKLFAEMKRGESK